MLSFGNIWSIKYFECRALEILNLEGNELPAMPAGALKLRELSELNVRRNFMHPVFWSDFSRNEPQV